MFWRFGGYANISTIDTILDKPDFTLEELLEEGDLIQELKQHNTKLIEYLREDEVLEKLLEYVVAPKLEAVETPEEPADDDFKGKGRLLPFSRPRASSRATDSAETSEEEQEKKRNRHALVACEVLSSDTWSIYEALIENRQLIHNFWDFLSRPAPLDPLQASYFTKVNESLFEKKTEEMMELLWSLPDVVPDLLKHVECPMIMDLLLKIIAMDRNEGGQGVVEWLYTKDIIPTLLSFLSPDHSWVLQTAAGDFLKAIITISANASQNEQQCIGPNELTRQLVSKPCVEQLISYMLGGGNPLTVGVGIIIEVIRKNNSDYDPDVGTEANTIPSSRDPIYLGTLLRLFALNVPKFMSLIMNGPSRKQGLDSTFGEKLEPLGFDRFKTCELMAELLHCSNMGLLNETGSEQLIASRDTERQRLRVEGRLGPREDSDSADDLTMRMTHSAHDESRRLEVTNADDDGFEEVEPNNEMGDDTSEFIKADDDIVLSGNQSSFLEKEEDIFVDEPLSSPKLTVGVDKLSETHFEEPDLVVAPLSPTKAKAAEPPSAQESGSATISEETRLEAPEATKEEDGEEPKKDSSEPAKAETKDVAIAEASDSSKTDIEVPDTPTIEEVVSNEEDPISINAARPEVKISVDELTPGDAGLENYRGLSPHPEDTPAPLFSAPLAPDSGVQHPPQVSVKPLSAPEPDTSAVAPTSQEEPTDQPADKLAEETSEEPKASAAETVEPVVGDFLKMQFVEHRVVPTILSFFFAYPWNNFLHNVVYDIVQQVFNGPMDRGYNPTLAVSLFEAADVTTAIINGQRASDESQAKTKTRMGYMGHLTLIAEEVVKFTERHPPELLSEMVLDKVMSQDWINYVEGALAETRERDNAILGGVRPEVALGNRASIGGSGLAGIGLSSLGGNSSVGASNALAEAGLNGGIEVNENGGNGIGPFAISSGTLMSGFGSSSDEEDEEGEGDEEDVNSEVSDDSSEEQGTEFPEATMNMGHPPENIITMSPEPIQTESSRIRRIDPRLTMRLAALTMEQRSGGEHSEEDFEDDYDYSRFYDTSAMIGTTAGTSRPGIEELEAFDSVEIEYLRRLLFRAYTDPLNNPGGSMTPPSIPPPPPPPPPLNIPPSRARLQLAARLAMHQKNNAVAQASSATVHDDNDDDDNDLTDPFGDAEEDLDDDLDDDANNFGRGSWWREVVTKPAEREEDSDDEEFGDFAMAEDAKEGDDDVKEKVLLKPNEKDKKADEEKEERKNDVVVPILERNESTEKGEEAVEVKEAQSRTSIDDDEDVATEFDAGTLPRE
ncbi:Extragenic suppressor of kinetochore protein 1 [Cladobotryum mycophilum]|uniref:Extragenic suppressor of kinetochore protein 1 n=1 Tax=Cladobotryum mycophilum TaxID=491253 RepID=A0ABR0SBD1_9HYPO